MKNHSTLISKIILISLFLNLNSCKSETVISLPNVTTASVSYITTTTAVSGGILTSDKNSEITIKGVCWSKTSNPTINNDTTKNGSGIGNYTSYLKNLLPNTKYFLRAYATNNAGTAYGNEVNFTTNIETTNTGFAKGADVSWLPQMEASGFKFYNASGAEKDCIEILKENGINSIRLRTWVNPSNDKWSGHCSKDETVAMAIRAKNAGMRVMIDFHYSDSWADPSKQVKPAAWASYNFTQLQQAVYDYTYDVMNSLKTAGVTPEWVQVGNEIPSGMIYPDGYLFKVSGKEDWTSLVALINKGYDAIKAVSPTSKVILHVDKGNDNARFRWWFDNAKTNGAKYDVIGLSYYPYWLTGNPDYTLSINDLAANLNDMVSRYGKEVMVVEVGGEDTKPQNTYDMLTAVIQKVKAVSNNRGLGVFYWEPQGESSWSKYALSAWMNGKPTKAMEAFK